MDVLEAAEALTSAVMARGQARDSVALMERLPKWLLCVPLVVQWTWLGFRYRAIALPALVNPDIETGGIVGESKLACLQLITPDFAAWVAPTVAVADAEDAEARRANAGFAFPLIAKPDIGWCGYGVRRIDNASELSAYARAFRGSGTFLLQPLIPGPGEAGIAYVRWPGAARGKITALTLRHTPHVVGDGHMDVAGLIGQSERTRRKADLYRETLDASELARVPALGERVTLTTIASLRVGSRYEDAAASITPELDDVIDRLARSMGEFHYGRFDVRFEALASLREGRFTIIEVNGAGAEAIQFWDPHVSVWQGFRGVFAKQRLLFQMGAAMRKQGRKPLSLRGFARAFFRQQKLTRHYPPSN